MILGAAAELFQAIERATVRARWAFYAMGVLAVLAITWAAGWIG